MTSSLYTLACLVKIIDQRSTSSELGSSTGTVLLAMKCTSSEGFQILDHGD